MAAMVIIGRILTSYMVRSIALVCTTCTPPVGRELHGHMDPYGVNWYHLQGPSFVMIFSYNNVSGSQKIMMAVWLE